MFIVSSEHRICFILLFHLDLALRAERAFSCQLIVTVAAFVAVSQSGSSLEAVAHIVGYHIVNAAYSGEHSLCAEFFCECDKPAFCNVYLKAAAVDIAVIYLPVKDLHMNLLDELTLDDLDEEQRDLAECIGIEAYKKLVSSYAGNPINVRMPERITMKLRNDKIRLEFNGYNYADLSKKYGLCKNQIRNIVADLTVNKRNQPLADQISFDDLD